MFCHFLTFENVFTQFRTDAPSDFSHLHTQTQLLTGTGSSKQLLDIFLNSLKVRESRNLFQTVWKISRRKIFPVNPNFRLDFGYWLIFDCFSDFSWIFNVEYLVSAFQRYSQCFSSLPPMFFNPTSVFQRYSPAFFNATPGVFNATPSVVQHPLHCFSTLFATLSSVFFNAAQCFLTRWPWAWDEAGFGSHHVLWCLSSLQRNRPVHSSDRNVSHEDVCLLCYHIFAESSPPNFLLNAC
jgi:hypothetical protein